MPRAHLIFSSILSSLACASFLAAVNQAAETASGSAAASAPASAIQDRTALFEYDHDADLRVTQVGTETRGAVTVRDVTFAADPREPETTTRAYIVAPADSNSHAAVLWVHWLGEPTTTNRTQFLEEAVALGGRGVVSVLVDAMWSAPKWYGARVLEEDYANSIRQVVALRRAMDLLLSQPSVDRARVAIVGHDYGAMYGTIAAAVDGRAHVFVFIAATPSLNDWAFFAKKPASMDDYLRQNRPLELMDFLREMKGGRFFMQFAEHDQYVPLAKAQEYFAAAPDPKQLNIYGGAGHEMTEPAAIRIDRDAFLARELGLK